MIRNLIFFVLLITAISCGQSYSPKPRGFVRIDLPEKQYQSLDTLLPYSFEYPVYSRFMNDNRQEAEPYWGNLIFPDFKGVIYLSYKPVNSSDDLDVYFEDARTFVNKHIPKASSLNDHIVNVPERDVYGFYHEIRGREVASPVQFYVTDSLDHFLRGALYFNVAPDNDSLAPVIDFIREDILHLLTTLEWKNLD